MRSGRSKGAVDAPLLHKSREMPRSARVGDTRHREMGKRPYPSRSSPRTRSGSLSTTTRKTSAEAEPGRERERFRARRSGAKKSIISAKIASASIASAQQPTGWAGANARLRVINPAHLRPAHIATCCGVVERGRT
jgi:hypothetical protein